VKVPDIINISLSRPAREYYSYDSSYDIALFHTGSVKWFFYAFSKYRLLLPPRTDPEAQW
jgi:hypothetical protein